MWHLLCVVQSQDTGGLATPQGRRAGGSLSWMRSKQGASREAFVPGSEFGRGHDFVAAYFSTPNRHALIEAGREWRKARPRRLS